MEITVIKHGKTDYNLQGLRQGSTDLPLNKIGRQEARELKENILQNFDVVFSSPLKRAVETAEILFPDREIQINVLLTEYDFGELEGVPFSRSVKDFPDNEIVEYNGIVFLLPNDGDSFENVVSRCDKFLKLLKENYAEETRVAVVTHSTVLEIMKALVENKSWFSYLAKAKEFHGFVKLNI